MIMTPDRNKPKRPIGVFIFGWLLIISSLIQLTAYLFGYLFYKEILGYLPVWVINIRYGFSIVQRILGLSVGIGLLQRIEICRKIAIAIAVFSIATLYWKHHHQAFLNFYDILYHQYGAAFKAYDMSASFQAQLGNACLIMIYGLDLIFFGLLGLYLNRSAVKAYFTKSHQNI